MVLHYMGCYNSYLKLELV